MIIIISYHEQSLVILKEAKVERIYQEKITGTKFERLELNKMLDNLRQGDTVIVSDLSRLSRSTRDLFKLIDHVESKGANIISLKETWIDKTTPQGKLLFTILAGIRQFEADLVSQSTKEGLSSARARGRFGGKKPNSNDKVKIVYRCMVIRNTQFRRLQKLLE